MKCPDCNGNKEIDTPTGIGMIEETCTCCNGVGEIETPKVTLTKSERENLKLVNRVAENIGYGNCISYLKKKWLDKLNSNPVVDDNHFDEVPESEPYPKDFLSEYKDM